MNQFKLLFMLFLLSTLFACGNRNTELKSPSGKLRVKLYVEEGKLKIGLSRNDENLLQADAGKFTLESDVVGNGYTIEKVERSSTDESWKPVYGERSSIRDNYNEMILTLVDKDAENVQVKLECRLYDEGFAFRYLFDSETLKDGIIQKELTTFNFNGDHSAWATNKAQGHIVKIKISDIKKAAERPLVIQQDESTFLALGEAALVDYARGKWINNGKGNSLQIDLTGTVNLRQANYKSPWRYVMVGSSPGELLENNYLIQNLNEPNQIENTSWIKPGKVIREVTLTTKGAYACIDFAARHNIEYVEFDAGWYGNEYDDASDASTITVDPRRSPGPLDLLDAVKYAENKGVGILLYVNRRALEKQLDEILPLFKSWGIKGIKYGFVNVGSQEWTDWLHDAIRKAAKYEMMVDVHDQYRPTGYERTYPNLMTLEGIRGDEESPSVEHSINTLFTRMIAGAGDNTNCFLAERVSQKMGGKSAQMAKAIMLYSPLNFIYWYDRPEGSPVKKGGAGSAEKVIDESEDLSFYDDLQVVWDDTKVLEGEMGAYATVARKSNDDWFVGSLAAHTGREVKIPLSFLDENASYEAKIYYQDTDDLKKNIFKTTTVKVNKDSVLERKLIKDSGLAVVIKKK
ncbi:hypothetical protein D1614_00245 [Maribellus luteus]|uniref:Alpha-glucosidase n=1 Tax=Maribellus luteus TaxID=2305463 RepID=A0A399T883_9BACT|nr:glycoside hydrolase family 97 protein [Maribellus luteus]RIJ50407.1 hypothetical protein D1614_00245 [Maribellus luteus]